jgi:biopolymer transport protein ExbD
MKKLVLMAAGLMICAEGVAASVGPIVYSSSDPVVILIPSDGEFYIVKEVFTRAEVLAEVEKRLKNAPDSEQVVYIKPAGEVRFETVTAFIDDLKSKGVKRIGLMADRKKNGSVAGNARSLNEGELQRRESFDLTVSVESTLHGGVGIKVGNSKVPPRDLTNSVRTKLRSRPDKSVVIQAPGATPYRSIVDMIDKIRAGGAKVFGLRVTRP